MNGQKLTINNQAGLIALTSVIILGAVVLLLIIGIFGGAVSEMERGGEKEKGEKALSWANLCMEVALSELRNDPDYAGEEEKTVDGLDGSCDILIFDPEESTITITTEGEVASHVRRMQVEIEGGSNPLNVTSWREI